MARFCSACGTEVGDAAAFCPKCGKSVAPAAAVPGSTTAQAPAQAAGLQDNVAGLLAYLFIPAIIFLVMEPYNRNKFIRFHSFQAIFYEVAWIIVVAVLGVFAFLGFFLIPLFGLAFTIGWIVCMIKAFQNQYFKLPVIGDIAEKQANG